LEQIRNDACYHNLNITIVASGGGFSYGSLGMSHHATEDIAILRALPAMSVVAPGTVWEAGEATEALIKSESVGYLRLDKTVANESDVFSFSLGGQLDIERVEM
jgi:transketolase